MQGPAPPGKFIENTANSKIGSDETRAVCGIVENVAARGFFPGPIAVEPFMEYSKQCPFYLKFAITQNVRFNCYLPPGPAIRQARLFFRD